MGFNSSNGKVAVVTGASGNLGPVWVDILEKNNYKIIPFDLPQHDISDEGCIKSFCDMLIAKDEIPDILVNNAAIDNPPGSSASFFGNFDKIIDVNLKGAVKMTSYLIGHMSGNGGGNIVHIGSMLGFTATNPELYPEGFDKPCAYGASKAALWNFTNNCNTRYARHGVVSNMLALSAVEGKQSEDFKTKYTARIPIKRMLRREDFENEFWTCCNAKVPYDAPLFVGGGYTIW